MTTRNKTSWAHRTISKDVRLVFCSFAPVGLDDYVQYFANRFDSFVYLRWKFPHSRGRLTSSLEKYQKGERIVYRRLFSLPSFQSRFLYFLLLPFHYLVYLSQCLALLRKRESEAVTVFIGVNYFCTFCGILLKKLGRTDVVVYRVMDFFPLPPRGIYRYLNRIFYVIDKFCLNKSDHIWFTTEGHIIGREKYGYFRRSEHNYQLIPLGLDISRLAARPIDGCNATSLVYCGVISKYHLLDLLFEVMQELKRDFPDIKLNLIGSGPDEAYFKESARRMNLHGNVVFHGFLEEGEEFAHSMSDNILGIALYRDEEDFMKYTEPAKVKLYLRFGVPAVVSRVPVIAGELEKKKVCFAVDNNKEEIAEVIRNFILDTKLQAEYKDNVKEFVKSLDINRLLDEVFLETFGQAPERHV